MLFVLVGLLLGLLVSLGPLSFAARPFDAFAETLVSAASTVLGSILGGPDASSGLLTVAAVLSVVTPGVVAILLVATSRANQSVRRQVAGTLFVLSLVSFFVLPATSSLVLLGASLVFAVFAGFFSGFALTLPLVFLATVLGVRYGVMMWEGTSPELLAASSQVALVTDTPDMLSTWQLVLAGVGLFPFALAVLAVFKR